MRFSRSALLATCLPVASARFVEKHESDADNVVLYPDSAAEYLIETAPGETQWVTEEDKWELRRVRLSPV
jgi:leucyl aminopeptidase